MYTHLRKTWLKLSNILFNDPYEFPSLLSKPNNVRKPSIPEREVRHRLDYQLPINCFLNSWRMSITFTISCSTAQNFVFLDVRKAYLFYNTVFSWNLSDFFCICTFALRYINLPYLTVHH